jgi:PDZ domain-containing protein
LAATDARNRPDHHYDDTPDELGESPQPAERDGRRQPGAPAHPDQPRRSDEGQRPDERRPPAWRTAGRALLSGPFVLLSIIVACVLGVTALLVGVQTPYQLVLPGPVTDVQRLIEPYPKPIKGALYLTTIYSDPANLAEWAYGKVRADAGLVPREEARPRNVSERQYQQLLSHMMDESKIAAKVVGLRHAGYEVSVTGQGAQVQEVTENAPAQGALQPGDIITAADGKPVSTATDLVALTRAHKPGETITMTVQRGDGEAREVSFALGESPDEPGQARAGIIVLTHLYEYHLPKELDLETRDIGGPSAGLMFALGVYNAVAPGDITQGHKIAGTGTITTDGTVGAVGGVKYKVVAAQRAGAELFLAPADDYEEARQAAGDGKLKVVPVKTFDDALAALAALPPAA